MGRLLHLLLLCVGVLFYARCSSQLLDLSHVSHLGSKLFRRLASVDKPSNVSFSPQVIWAGMGRAYLCAEGRAGRQMMDVLQVTGKNSILEQIFAQEDVTSGFPFKMGDRLYANVNLPVNPCYAQYLGKHIRHIDFSERAQAANTMNTFINNATSVNISSSPNEVEDYLTSLPHRLLFVFVSGASFSGPWLYRFEEAHTLLRPFFHLDGWIMDTTPMMVQNGLMRYGRSYELDAHILELPYAGEALSMFLLLPDRRGRGGWAEMLAGLNRRTLQEAINRANSRRRLVKLLLPRFRMETLLKGELKEALRQVGLGNIFDRRPRQLVSETLHRTVVVVEEAGTKPLPQPYFTPIMSNTPSFSRYPRPIRFFCNRPFAFIIKDNDTKSVLLMGAYKDSWMGNNYMKKRETSYE